jgi:hypothetical protein
MRYAAKTESAFTVLSVGWNFLVAKYVASGNGCFEALDMQRSDIVAEH